MRPPRFLPGSLVILGLLGALTSSHAVTKADNTTNLNVGTSWTGSVAPGVFDIGQWTSIYSAASAATPLLLGANLSWQGIQVTNPGGAVTIGAGNTLTIGVSGVSMSTATQNLTISSGLTLLANTDQVWNIGSGRTFAQDTGAFTRSAGATLNVQGSGTVTVASLANDATGIVGAWATFGTGVNTKYAMVSGGAVAGYTGTAAVTAADVTSTAGTVNYDVAAGGTLGAGASVSTLRYTGGVGTISGAIQTNGLLHAGSGALTASGNVTIGASKEFVVNTGNNAVTLSGAIGNNAGGASSLIKVGGGTLTLSGVNTYTGMTTISGGIIDIGTVSNGSLGSGGLLLNNNGILQGNGSFTRGLSSSPNPGAGLVAGQSGGFAAKGGTLTVNFGGAGAPIALNGSGFIFGNNFIFGSASADSKVILINPVVLNTNGQRTITVNSGVGGDSAEFQGVLSNGAVGFTPSGIAKSGTGTLILNAANTYTGITSVNAGTISISSIADGGVNSNLGASSNAAANLVLGNGKLQYTGATASTNRSFTINTAAAATIEVTNAAATLTISGATTGTTGALTKTGLGTLNLSGANLHTGTTSVNAGKLVISGSLASTTTTVAAGATPATLASGNNTSSAVGTVSVGSDASGGGTVAPGDSGGSGSTSVGKLNINGTFTLGTGVTAGKAHLTMELGGTTAGSLYDQVATTGNVSLNSVNLDLSLVNGFASTVALNDTFILVLNGGANAVSGTFANAPENQLTVEGVTFAVNYGFNADGGTTANDIQLTVAAVPEPGSMALLGSAIALALGLRRSRRRA